MTITTTEQFLDANLAALGPRHAALAARLRATTPATLEWSESDDGALSATLDGVPLASRRAPQEEGARLAERVDLLEYATVVVLGFGVGHHVAALARRIERLGLVVVFEPDLALLRAVFDRIDCSSWLQSAHVVIATETENRAELAILLEGADAVLGQGVTFLEHPPSRRRLGDRAAAFSTRFAEFLQTVKTLLLTTLIRSIDTIHNYLHNARPYCGGSGIDDLAGIATDYPAVIVSAGPSLRRNIALLAEPGVRDRCVIIAVQTTLFPLLEAGVRPHYVVALDYHEISRRFYEQLTPEDVAGVTLVIDPKAHPAIPAAFPGPIRCCASPLLDRILGPDHPTMGTLENGATVAHLGVYLARHMGCNPVLLVGQDLGFPDGLYYAPGTAIHEVWSPELNPFNTIAMMEWQRIVRHRRHLHRVRDISGQEIYTDTQMLAYLQQFERDFEWFVAEGTTIIDATEGGARIRHTDVRSLTDALADHATRPLPALPEPQIELDTRRLQLARARFQTAATGVREVGDLARATGETITVMLDEQDDPARMAEHFATLDRHRLGVEQRMEWFEMINALNQLGVYKRMRADRRLHLQEHLGPKERQRGHLERDLANVQWVDEASRELLRGLDAAIAALDDDERPESEVHKPDDPGARSADTTVRIGAVIAVDPDRCARDVTNSLVPEGAAPTLARVVRRLASVTDLDAILLLADESCDLGLLLGDAASIDQLTIVRTDGTPFGPEQAAITAAHRFAPHSWRGAPGGLTIYDSLVCPAPMLQAMETHQLDAAVLVGADWPWFDISPDAGLPALLQRFRERPEQHAVVFSQAPPGLGSCVVSQNLMSQLVERTRLSTIGATLSYIPADPHPDPIAGNSNIQIDARVRHAKVRAIVDNERSLHQLSPLDAGADSIAVVDALTRDAVEWPDEIRLDLTTERAAHGLYRQYLGPAVPAGQLTLPQIQNLATELAAQPPVLITLLGAGDPLRHPDFVAIVELLRSAGAAAIHVRTELADDSDIDRLLECGAELISVDLHADTAATYERMLGADRFPDVLRRLDRLISRRRHLAGPAGAAGFGLPIIVPRLLRCPETIEDLETFFDRWLHVFGTAAIDPLPHPVPERLSPAVTPAAVIAHTLARRLTIGANGAVVVDECDLEGHSRIGTIGSAPLHELWPLLCAARTAPPLRRSSLLLP